MHSKTASSLKAINELMMILNPSEHSFDEHACTLSTALTVIPSSVISISNLRFTLTGVAYRNNRRVLHDVLHWFTVMA